MLFAFILSKYFFYLAKIRKSSQIKPHMLQINRNPAMSMSYAVTHHILNTNDFAFPFQAQNGDKNKITFLLENQHSLGLSGLLLRLEVLLQN